MVGPADDTWDRAIHFGGRAKYFAYRGITPKSTRLPLCNGYIHRSVEAFSWKISVTPSLLLALSAQFASAFLIHTACYLCRSEKKRTNKYRTR